MDPKESKHLNPRAIFSKTGKGVHEASGKTSHLSRADRAVLAAIDGKTPLSDISAKFDKLPADKFDALIQLLDKDGFVREVSSGQSAAPTPRPAAPAAKPPPKAPPSADEGDDMDFTQAIKVPPRAPAAPKPPPIDLAATARAGAERKAEEDLTLNFRAREELQAKLKAELAAQAKADAKAKAEANAAAEAKAASEAKSRAEAEAKARAEAEAKTRAEADAKVKAAREAAVRMATEVKAKAEADAKLKTEAAQREKERIEAELNAKLDAERKARKDLEEKARRDAEEMRQRLEAEMKAKLDAERKVREEEDRKRREEEDRKRKDEDERRAKEDAERRAREEADRKMRAEEDRKRKEEDERRRKEEDERRAKDEAERKARDEADRKKREEERKQREEDDRRRKEEDARRAKEDAERKARDTDEAKARAAASASLPAIEPVVAPPPPPPPPPAAAAPPASDLGDLLGDLDNFGKQEEEERKAKEEAERQAKETAARKAKEAAERRAREEAEAKRREEEERRRKAEEEQRAQEEAERKAREEEERRKREEAERKQEEAERKRKAKEALAANLGGAQAARGGDEVDAKDDDADLDDIKRDQKALAKRAAAREQPMSAVVASSGRPKRWGKPVAIAVFALLVVGVGVLHVMPLSTADYEKGASAALGAPVKIGSARLSLITGVEVNFENVAIGDSARIRLVRGFPEIGSLFGERKAFSRVELEGVSMGQSQIADALLGKAAGANFRVGRVMAKQLSLDGPVKLPPLDVDAALSDDGSVQSVRLTGSDRLLVQISPKGSEMAFEISAGSLALPLVPALNLADFAMKGTANRSGVTSASFDGRAYEGVISGTARIQWGANWSAEGEVRARGVKVAVFAPALISQGKVEGEGKFAMSGADAAKLYEGARLEGNFKIENGVLGKFNLRRALETGGAQTGGRTEFAEMTGQGVYERGAAQLRNLAFSSGAMNANVSIDIDANGGISGRISADVKTPNQTLRAILNVSGKVQDPVIRK